MLALFTISSLIPLVEVFAVLAIFYVFAYYVLPLPPNIRTGIAYVIGIVALVYLFIWAIRALGGAL